MKKIKSNISIAIVLLQFAFVTTLTAGNSTVSDTDSKTYFISAKEEINDMLSGKIPLNYERAIYLIENAYWENQIDYSFFQYEISFHTEYIKRIIETNWVDITTDFKPTFLESVEQKREKYEKALTNWAIFSYLTDTTFLINNKKTYYHFPFRYSNNDPLGTLDWSSTQVSNLLSKKVGNCYALASLFKIFSERLNSEANICTAPGHIYIRHADHKGIFHNVELATRSFPGTGTMETLTYTTDDGTKNGISLRELDMKKSVALCLVYLAKGYEYKFGIKDDDFILGCGELALQYDSLNLNAILLKAEVFEERTIKKNKSVAQLQNDKLFQQYEKLIAHLYKLGYREMPMEMKNYVIAKLRNDSTAMIFKDHTPQPFAHLGVKEDRYATLSGGLFDEMHETKPLEQYQRTVFDTKKNKIKKFVGLDTTYNNYPIDMVVFAWSIDPLAHKYPYLSPYAAFNNNPILYVDPDGREGIIVSGQPGDHNVRQHFLINGLDRAKTIAAGYKKAGNGEQATWIIYNGGGKAGHDAKDIAKYTQQAQKLGINVMVVSDADDIVDYVNEKNGEDSRSQDPITNFAYIGHATPGDLDVGYEAHADYWFEKALYDHVEPSDFDADAFADNCNVNVVGGCNTAVSGELPGEKSVIKQFAKILSPNSTIKGSSGTINFAGSPVDSDKQLTEREKSKVVEIKGEKKK